MPTRTRPDPDVTPEAVEVLRVIVEETCALREIDLADIPPANVFEAD